MADQPVVPDSVTPSQFFSELLPMGFEAQRASGAAVPQDFAIQYHLTGDGGGSWHVQIKDGKMTATEGTGESVLTFTLSVEDFKDCVLGRNGGDLAILLPQSRPGRPDNSGRAKGIKGTIVQELAREGEPLRVEMMFNGAEKPRAVLKVKLADFVAMQQGKLNGQEAFMTGRLRIEGDMALMMQVAALTA